MYQYSRTSDQSSYCASLILQPSKLYKRNPGTFELFTAIQHVYTLISTIGLEK